MTKEVEKEKEENQDNICEECIKEDESVIQNLILTGYKVCNSCKISKTIFPIQLIFEIGKELILLITKEIDKNAIIKKDKNIIPKALKLDFKFKICFVEIIRAANIQN